MPIILLFFIAGIFFLNSYIPLEVQGGLYALSLSIKSFIIFLLPLLIFSLLFKVACQLVKQASQWILLIFVSLIVSNFISTWLGHYIGLAVYNFDFALKLPNSQEGLQALWNFELPKLLPNDIAMFAGLISGALIGIFKADLGKTISEKLDLFVRKILKLFMMLIPPFVAGFFVKMQADGVLTTIVKNYAVIFLIIFLSQYSYIGLLYAVMNRFNIKKFFISIKNMLPAGISAFTTMSSAASMPLTLLGTEKNSKDKDLAKSVIPVTVNIHLIGDCFAIPILAFAIMKSFEFAQPDLFTYFIFSLYFVLAKFSVAAIPGGGIIVMLPILEKYLGFNSQMLSLITALYILFDPVITSANVMGNGAFAMFIDRLKSWRTSLK